MRTINRTLMLVLVVMVANAVTSDAVAGDPPQITKFHGHPSSSGQKLNYDSLFNAATPLSSSPKAQALIDGVMLRYGGRSELEKLTSLALDYVPDGSQNSNVTITKLWRSGRRLKYSKAGSVQPTSRYLNGQECWLILKEQLHTATKRYYKAELYSYLVLAMPLAIEKESFPEIKYGQRENDSLEYLYLHKPDSLMIVLGIDSENYLIKSCEGIVYEDENRVVFKNLLSDFRDVHGYTFPHRIQNISLGLDMGALILENVEINPSLPDELFRPKEAVPPAQSH